MEAGREYLQSDWIEWEIGLFHPWSVLPAQSWITLDGERVVKARFEAGYTRRGIEQRLTQHPWLSGIAWIDQIDPEGAPFWERIYCEAIEKLVGVRAPPRAVAMRVILCELSRIAQHLTYFARLGEALGVATLLHFSLREKERVLDLFELLTGARFTHAYIRPGGIATEVSAGFLERVIETCQYLRLRMREYEQLVGRNDVFLRRVAFLAVVGEREVERYGLSGPVARASGASRDLRRTDPAYGPYDFDVPLGRGLSGSRGDALDRFEVRTLEVEQSIRILLQAAEDLPGGVAFRPMPLDGAGLRVPAGEAEQTLEGARGAMQCRVHSDGGDRPVRVEFVGPSSGLFAALPRVLEGARLDELRISVESLDISMLEVDR